MTDTDRTDLKEASNQGAHNVLMWFAIELRRDIGMAESVSMVRLMDMINRYHRQLGGRPPRDVSPLRWE